MNAPAGRNTSDVAGSAGLGGHRGIGYRALFVLLLCLLVVYPILNQQRWAVAWADVLVYLVLVAGILAVARSHRHRALAMSLGATTLVALNAAMYVEATGLQAFGNLCGVSFFTYLAAVILRDVFAHEHRMSAQLIYGALSVYLLIGIAFAFAYQLFDILDPAAFDNSGLLSGNPTELFEGFLYFSFVTMTTLGFGDISPHTPQAGAFVTAQAIIGQMYLAVLVARLVGLQTSSQPDGEPT